MHTATVKRQTIFLPSNSSLFRRVGTVLVGVLILAAASQLSIPLKPVPLTFQSATAILIGMALGSRVGAEVIATYLIAGAMGLPVFADFSTGLPTLMGPTGGYLVGFLPAAFIGGYLVERRIARGPISSFFAAYVAAIVLFTLGVTHLATFVGWNNAIHLGVKPFVVSETIKLIALAMIVPKLWKN